MDSPSSLRDASVPQYESEVSRRDGVAGTASGCIALLRRMNHLRRTVRRLVTIQAPVQMMKVAAVRIVVRMTKAMFII